jgi:hypothetical protein
MKYIAEGYQYKVYDLGNGKVFKKPQSFMYSFRKNMEVAKKQLNFSVIKQIKYAWNIHKRNDKAIRNIRDNLTEFPLFMFGNAKFKNGSYSFEQDKVVSLEEYISGKSIEVIKDVFDQYLELQEIMWQYVIHDAVYKFQPNYGLDKDERVFCLDFGELLFNEDEIIKSIQNKPWLLRPSYKKWIEDEFKIYYTKRMDEVINENNFLKHWKKQKTA